MQERDFRIEILIHDDASTDGSADIIREYEEKYPDIIKPVYQSENQYSKGISNPSGVFNFPRAAGKYIAMCEGDDYWSDPLKLKKQVDFMENHEDFSFSCHSASIVYENTALRTDVSGSVRPYTGTREISPAEVISKKINIPTASLLFRTGYVRDLPDWYFDCPVGDIPLQLWLIEHGSCWYFDEDMSVYREGRSGSWGEMMDKAQEGCDCANWERHFEAMKRMYEAFDLDTDGVWHEAVAEAVGRQRFLIDLKEGNAAVVLNHENALYVSELPAAEAFLQRLKARAPGIYGLMRNMYRRIHF